MSENVKEITDASFNDIINGDKPVLVDFWAEWCGPCRAVAPIIEELAGDNADKAIVGKLDVDSNPQTPTQFGVTSIPTIILFKGGEPVERVVGSQTKATLQSLIDSALG